MAAVALETGNQLNAGNAGEGSDSEGETTPRGDTQATRIAAHATLLTDLMTAAHAPQLEHSRTRSHSLTLPASRTPYRVQVE